MVPPASAAAAAAAVSSCERICFAYKCARGAPSFYLSASIFSFPLAQSLSISLDITGCEGSDSKWMSSQEEEKEEEKEAENEIEGRQSHFSSILVGFDSLV